MIYYIMGRYMEVWGGVLGSRQGTGFRLRVSRGGWLSSQEDKTEKDVVGEIGPETGRGDMGVLMTDTRRDLQWSEEQMGA